MELNGFVEARVLSVQDIIKVAERMHFIRTNTTSRKPFSQREEFVDLMGRWQFAKEYCLEIDLSDPLLSGRQPDIVTEMGTVRVSTHRKHRYLLRSCRKRSVDFHVLAKFASKRVGYREEEYTVTLLGWETDEEMLKCPIRMFGHGDKSHYKHVSELRSMLELNSLLKGDGIQARLL